MTNSANSFPKPSVPKWLVPAILIVSFIGFSDATYLTVEHFLGNPITCSVLGGCLTVTSSSYATIGRIPVALLGSLYYAAVFILSVAYFDTKRREVLTLLAFVPIAGFLASLWFVYLQFFVIKAICLYCMISAISSTTLFGLGIYLLQCIKRKGVTLDDSTKKD